ncbi:arsenate reductase/protein-tyrosine-phosphatase family protein [Agrococcus sp. SGAir0287]|uniref:arsenate reductase/protein-tyrosine-phosphatase family protein n=1 Tax=Agrococcus sp. SGAir0287 TaxID=2070347 RepID=UPI0010CCB360|nr:low molecular weight phosphatase family protein [Agrococcus sp. SGAir0287]QCR19871.1 low molecular weight phosphatase family protein [Agrococcus sp. SGAir0287]
MPLPSSPRDARDEGPFRILVVCTGNVCRSPLAAAVLRARLAQGTDAIAVASAGLQPREGEPVDPAVAREAGRLGVDVAGHAARALRLDEVMTSDLVIVATRRQRAVVAELAPAAASRTFTLLELDATLAQLDAGDVATPAPPVARDRLTQVVRAAARARGPAARGLAIDLPDPYRGSAEVHRGVADLVASASDRIAERLLALGASTPSAQESAAP